MLQANSFFCESLDAKDKYSDMAIGLGLMLGFVFPKNTAKIEIGKMNIMRMQKCVLIVAFFTIIFSVPVVQHIYEIRTFISGRSERLALWPQCLISSAAYSDPSKSPGLMKKTADRIQKP